VNPADGLYVPFPDTLALPTVIPPEVHDVGAVGCGPNTVNVIVPDGDAPPDSVPEIDEAEIAEPAVPDPGAEADSAGLAAPSTVSAIPAPQVDALLLLFESPP
jgi:hypothetical protein